jgi:hypothetical protein
MFYDREIRHKGIYDFQAFVMHFHVLFQWKPIESNNGLVCKRFSSVFHAYALFFILCLWAILGQAAPGGPREAPGGHFDKKSGHSWPGRARRPPGGCFITENYSIKGISDVYVQAFVMHIHGFSSESK